MAGLNEFQIRAIVGTAWLAKEISGDLEVAGLEVKRSIIGVCLATMPEPAMGTGLLATDPCFAAAAAGGPAKGFDLSNKFIRPIIRSTHS